MIMLSPCAWITLVLQQILTCSTTYVNFRSNLSEKRQPNNKTDEMSRKKECVERCTSARICRSRKMLESESLLLMIRFDTAEDGPFKVPSRKHNRRTSTTRRFTCSYEKKA